MNSAGLINNPAWIPFVCGAIAGQDCQAIQRKHPDLPMQPGHVLRQEFEYIRHGTLSWFINLDVVSGQVIEPSWDPRAPKRMLSRILST
jgi:hypothetical protein